MINNRILKLIILSTIFSIILNILLEAINIRLNNSEFLKPGFFIFEVINLSLSILIGSILVNRLFKNKSTKYTQTFVITVLASIIILVNPFKDYTFKIKMGIAELIGYKPLNYDVFNEIMVVARSDYPTEIEDYLILILLFLIFCGLISLFINIILKLELFFKIQKIN